MRYGLRFQIYVNGRVPDVGCQGMSVFSSDREILLRYGSCHFDALGTSEVEQQFLQGPRNQRVIPRGGWFTHHVEGGPGEHRLAMIVKIAKFDSLRIVVLSHQRCSSDCLQSYSRITISQNRRELQ